MYMHATSNAMCAENKYSTIMDILMATKVYYLMTVVHTLSTRPIGTYHSIPFSCIHIFTSHTLCYYQTNFPMKKLHTKSLKMLYTPTPNKCN